VNPLNYVPGLDSGYLCVMCRATDDPAFPDTWTSHMRRASWESMGLCNHAMLAAQPESGIRYRGARTEPGIDIWSLINDPSRTIEAVDDLALGHTFQLADRL
jgi:hypothetical protein